MKIKNLFTGLLIIFIISYVTGCGPIGTWQEQERQMIDEFLDSIKGTPFVLTESGLYFIEQEVGTGDYPVTGDTVYFKYAGMFLDGVVFDDYTADTLSPMKYRVGSKLIIDGIDEGLRYMKPGGIARILTPSSLAFGHMGIPGIIPGYTPLLWEIRLISLDKANGK